MSAPTHLNVSDTDTQRIFIGLGWDPNDSPTLKDKVGAIIGGRDAHHDLDLACYYFNQDGACLGYVSADEEKGSNPSGSIYHSGDSVEGIGDGDDEQISVELKNLPPNIVHLVFKASIKSGHSFSEVAAPEIRLCDGYTDREFLHFDLSREDNKANGYVFIRLSRGEDKATWVLNVIDRFTDIPEGQDWKTLLSKIATSP